MPDIFELQSEIQRHMDELSPVEQEWQIHKAALFSLKPKREELLRHLRDLSQQVQALYDDMAEDDFEEAPVDPVQPPKPVMQSNGKRPKGSVKRSILEFVHSCGAAGALAAPILEYAHTRGGAVARLVHGGYLTQAGKRKPYHLTEKGRVYLNSM